MSTIEKIQKKSVTNSNAGDALNTISTILLIGGIITSIIIFAHSTIEVGYKTEVNWISVTSGIEVLIGSIFLCIFGKAVAKIVNFAQAIYKNTNSDFEFDTYLKAGARFMAGDKAETRENGESIPLIIKSMKLDAEGYLKYICETETNEIKEYSGSQLRKPSTQKDDEK
ncbi:MAG: hypothetical protein MJZ97_11000 [Bacteroidales bacterium]|nr:hypothetical protein [Bacteroidales bacterium]